MKFNLSNSLKSCFLLSLALAVSVPSFATTINPSNTPGCSGQAGSGTLAANSCVDYSYTFTQGMNNWKYGYYQGTNNPTGFLLMPTPTGTQGTTGYEFWAVNFNQYWTSLDATSGHPNSVNTSNHPPVGGGNSSSVTQWAVRRFIVPNSFTGSVNISMTVSKDPRDAGQGDGTTTYVFYAPAASVSSVSVQNTSTIQSFNTLGSVPVAAAQTAPQTLTLTGVSLHPGDVLDFAIAPNANDYTDGTLQLAQITSLDFTVTAVTPEPASLLLVGGGLALAGLLRRKVRS